MAIDWKARTVANWTEFPCGAVPESGAPGTPEFLGIESRRRYAGYHQWLPAIAPWRNCRGLRVLEVGCGMGLDAAQFVAAGADYTGVDITPRHLEIARQHLAIAGGGTVVKADAETLPFPDGSFDLVYSFGVLHHTPGTERAIAEIHRVLRPGGRAFVMLYHRDSLDVLRMIWGIIKVQHVLPTKRRVQDWLSRNVEVGSSEQAVLVKIYSRGDVRRMFGAFRSCRVRVRQAFGEYAWGEAAMVSPTLWNRVRLWLTSKLLRPLGFYLIIEATR